MQLKENMVEALIGAAVLGVGIWFASYGYARTQTGGSGGYTLIAKFPAAGSLNVGSDVKISGVKVGTVMTKGLDPKTYQARIGFTVGTDIKLPIDTLAKIGSEGLLGGSFLQLSPGGEIEMLKSGDEIEQTQGAVDFLDLVGKAIYKSTDAKAPAAKTTE
jgi:phospholipid/cholesterol/gamma-HCH transport system substrate-binding protein